VTTAGDEAIELARMVGTPLDPWQCRVLKGALGQNVNERWAAPEVGLVIPRQNGKSYIAEVAALNGIYLKGLKIVYTAHLMATSRKMRERIQLLIESHPDLDREVKQIRVSNEEQSIELKSRARIDFVARSGSTARGWSGDMVFFDEAFALATDHVGALMPILFARKNWQLWYLSSAGKPGSHALRRIRERGMARDPGLAYFEWSADEDHYRADPETAATDPHVLAQANPALGIRISRDTLVLAQRSMDPVEYAREVLGIWDDPRGAPLIDPITWGALFDPVSQIYDSPMVFALDVSPGLESGCIGVAGYRADKIPHVEITGRDGVLDHRRGVDWMVARVIELQAQWGPIAWVMDASGPAGALLTDLADAGIEPKLVNGRELAQACGSMLAAANAPDRDGLRHLGQLTLDESVRAAKKRDIGDGAWAFGRRLSEQDISPLMVVTLALHGLALFGGDDYDPLDSIR